MEIYICDKEICQIGNEFFVRGREIPPCGCEFFPEMEEIHNTETFAIKKCIFPLRLYAYYFIVTVFIIVVTFTKANATYDFSEPQMSKGNAFIPEAQEVMETKEYGLGGIFDLENYYIEWDSYVIQRGDTLWDIADQFTGNGLAYHAIVERNQISNPDLIFPETRITIPVLHPIRE